MKDYSVASPEKKYVPKTALTDSEKAMALINLLKKIVENATAAYN